MLDVLKEGGAWSFTRILTLVGYIAFLLASAYLVCTGKTWGNYDTFAALTGGGSGAIQIANKFINSKYNTALGEVGKKV